MFKHQLRTGKYYKYELKQDVKSGHWYAWYDEEVDHNDKMFQPKRGTK
jgi:hypothetical protein